MKRQCHMQAPTATRSDRRGADGHSLPNSTQRTVTCDTQLRIVSQFETAEPSPDTGLIPESTTRSYRKHGHLDPRRAPAAAGVAGDSPLMMTTTLQAVVGDDGVLLSRQLNHHETRYQITENNTGPKI